MEFKSSEGNFTHMHIDYAKVEFYLRFKKKKKKKKKKIGQLLPFYILPYEFKHTNNIIVINYFSTFFINYMEIVHTPHSQKSFSIFQISSIFFDYGGWVWKNKIKEIYFIFYIKYYKFKSEFIIMLFKILITWHHIT